MQKTKIEWVANTDGTRGYVFNPIKGLCKGGCPYCYARKLYKRFKWNPEIRFDYSAFEGLEKVKAGSKIFVCSTHDLFGNWICEEWIRDTILRAVQNPELVFIFLTKNPERYRDLVFPDNAWIGYSTTGKLFHKWDERHEDNIKFVSIEPMQAAMTACLEGYVQRINFQWLILGQETGNRLEKIVVEPDWVESTIEFATKAGIPIFLKNNLGRIKEEFGNREEFPKER